MTNQIHSDSIEKNKFRNLFLGLLFDGIGMLSFTIPVVGEFSDIVWAPISALLMAKLYKGTLGKVGGFFSFVEEVLPFNDFIPTFTIVWIYKYLLKK